MRTYGRVYSNDGSYVWQEVTTDANGNNDAVMVTTLIQVLLLNYGESPFYANYGIPAEQSVMQQVAPDYFVSMTQIQFSASFASIIITKLVDPNPHYRVNILTNAGATIQVDVPR
jgi:hypothetical protein